MVMVLYVLLLFFVVTEKVSISRVLRCIYNTYTYVHVVGASAIEAAASDSKFFFV